MSVWLVSKDHIDALVTAWMTTGDPEDYEHRAQTMGTFLGKVLMRANAESVAHRYQKQTSQGWMDYYFDPYPGPLDPVVHQQAVECLEYQSYEHPNWKASKARAALERIGETVGRLPKVAEAADLDLRGWPIKGRGVFAEPHRPSSRVAS